jgi:hypothetical protein
MARLYRGQTNRKFARKLDPSNWNYQARKNSGAIDASGRWFTSKLDDLLWYLDDAEPGKAQVVSVDFPDSDLESYRVSNFKPDPKEPLVDPRLFPSQGKATEEFFLPKELAKTATPRRSLRYTKSGKPKVMVVPNLPKRQQKSFLLKALKRLKGLKLK